MVDGEVCNSGESEWNLSIVVEYQQRQGERERMGWKGAGNL